MRSKMDLVSGYKGVVGLMFGNENSSSSEDSYVERLLERINNGTKAEDRRMAMTELQSVVAESHAAQLAFGAMGFPVLMCVLKEDRDDVEMIQGALETILGALTPLNYKAPKDGVQPATLNADLLSREADNISLLLSLLSEEDFYVRYYTLQLLTALLTNAPSRLQEVILATPQGITRLMDMLMDREVIRNEALLLLTYLTREAEEIQKIVVFENAYEKIFSIIREEGGSDGGVVVQDCLELLNNILRNNASNQTLLRETMGFDPVVHLLRLRDYSFTQQKTINLLGAIETINLLITVGSESDPSEHSNSSKNKTVLVQKGVLDNLLTLGVESHWAPASVHCAALRCIGDLIATHSNNMNVLASKVLGEGPEHEPALNSILKTVLRPSNMEEFVAADYVFKCFCENNPDGQTMLASTMIPQPHLLNNDSLADDISLSFGSMLLRGLTVNETDGDLEICSRSASVLSHILKDNAQCKEKALKIELEAPTQSLGGSEPLLHRMVKYLALASSTNSSAEKSKSHGKRHLYIPQIILKLLITWLMDSPQAVNCFLDARPHLTYLIELVGNTSSTAGSRGLAAILLGECVMYNDSAENGKDAFALADAISQKLGLTSYFLRFDELWRSSLFARAKQPEQRRPLTARSSTGNLSETEDVQEVKGGDGQGSEDHPILASLFDEGFVSLVRKLEGVMRERIVEVYSRPKNSVAVVPAELEQRGEESDREYIQRLKSFVQKQCYEIQDVLRRNASLAEDVAKAGKIPSEQRPASSGGGGSDRVHFETLGRELQEANQRVEILRAEKAKLESEASMFKNMASKTESDLKSLSDAYNSLEQTNYALENAVKAMRAGGDATYPDIEKIKEEAREEAQKESEGELNDLLVCLGQEQSKVEKLSSRLEELGEDVDKLLEDIGDEAALPEDGDDEDDDLNDDDTK